MTACRPKEEFSGVDMSSPSGTLALVPGWDNSARQVETLYVTSRSKLRPALAKRLGNAAEAEDVLHEAFARFLASYRGRSILNPLAMLAQIALNIVRDAARSERFRRNLLAERIEPVCAIAPTPDPESEASSRQDVRLLRDAIEALPLRCREAFILHRIEGLPHAEVARILGVSRSMVEKHLIKAYARLRTHLVQAGWSGIDKDGDGLD